MSTKLRELILLRHAKSDWKDDSHSDFERPISEKGKKQARKAANWLSHHELNPDLILISPAKRAQQTFKRLCKDCTTRFETIDSLYMAELDTLKNILAEHQDASRVMIIGHNPGLECLIRFLTESSEEESPILFPTGAIAHLILPADWTQLDAGDGKLQKFVKPSQMSLD